MRRRGAVAGVGRGQGCGGRGRESSKSSGGVYEWLVVEKECALMDKGLDDCLVGASCSQRVHSRKVWPHQRGPEADGQILTGHQIQPAQLAHLV